MHTALRSRDFLAGVAGLLVVVCCLKTPAADPLPAGALDPTFLPARPDGLVRDVAALPDGKVLIAGDFTKVGDLPRPAIARLNYDGSADDAFDPGSGPTGALGSTPARINTILRQSDGRILIGGVFTNFQGRARGCIARLWPNGALEEDELAGGGATNEVLALALQADGRILVGGKFTRFHGVHCAQLVRLLPDGRLDPTFQYRYQDASKRGISAIAVQSDGRIVIGGTLFLLRLNPDGAVDDSFSDPLPNLNSTGALVRDVDDSLLVGMISFMQMIRWQRLQPNSEPDPGYTNGYTMGIMVATDLSIQSDGKLLIPTDTESLYRFFPDGDFDISYSSLAVVDRAQSNYRRRACALLPDDRLVLAGSFTQIGGQDAPGLARFTSDTPPRPPLILRHPDTHVIVEGQPACLGLELQGSLPIQQQWWKDGAPLLQQTNASLFIDHVTPGDAGEYWVVISNSTGSATSRVARLGVDLSQPSTRNPAFDVTIGGYQYSDAERIIGQPGADFWITGAFTTVNGVPRNYAARLHADGALDESIDLQLPGHFMIDHYAPPLVRCSNGQVLVSSPFLQLFNPDGSLDSGFNPARRPSILSLAEQRDGSFLVGGDSPSQPLIRLGRDGAIDTAFSNLPKNISKAQVIRILSDDRILVGTVSPTYPVNKNGVIRVLPDGNLDPDWAIPPMQITNQTTIVVYDLACLAGGKTIVGGNFHRVSSQTRNHLVQLNSDGSVDLSFNPGSGPTRPVRALAICPDGRLLIGGEFTSYDGYGCNRIARVLPSGKFDRTFNPGSGFNERVLALSLSSAGSLLVGGGFTQFDGSPCSRLIQLDVDLAHTHSGPPQVIFSPRSQILTPRNDYDLDVFATGQSPLFFQWEKNGIPLSGQTNCLLEIHAAQAADAGVYQVTVSNALGQASSWAAALEFPTESFQPREAPADQVISIGQSACFQARASGSLPLTYEWFLNQELLPAQSNSLLYLASPTPADAGQYSVTITSADGAQWTSTATLQIIPPDAPGMPDDSFDLGLTNVNPNPPWIDCVAIQKDQKILAGGSFGAFFETPQQNLVRLDPNGQIDPDFNVGPVDGAVGDILILPDDRFLLAGKFLHVNDQSSPGVARLLPDGSLDPSFRPLEFPPELPPNLFVVRLQPGGGILIGGEFSQINGTTQSNLARLFDSGLVDPSFSPGIGPDGPVLSMQVTDAGEIYIAGRFQNYDQIPCPGLARLHADGRLDPSFAPAMRVVSIDCMALDIRGRLLVASSLFSTFPGPSARRSLTRLLPDGQVDPAFRAVYGPNVMLRAIQVLPDQRIFIGGVFSRYDQAPRNDLALLNPDGTLDSSFSVPEIGEGEGSWRSIHCCALQPDGRIVIGGSFRYLASQYRPSIARLHAPVPLLSLQLQAKIAEAQFHLECCATIGSRLQLQRSSNMLDWDPWTNLLATGSLQIIPDPDFSNSSFRFFRVLQEPGDSINP